MKLTILGFNSALPTANSHPTAQLLNICERYFLIDCGEGTQVQLRKSKSKFSKINHIFISHLHGDHVFGLVGLVSSFHLLGRDKPLTIYGPKGIKQFIQIQLQLSNAHNSFDLHFVELSSHQSEKIYEDDKVEVHTIPLQHRIYCNGYLFQEKTKKRSLNIQAIEQHTEIQICDYTHLKSGNDFVLNSGEIIDNEDLTFDPDKPLSYAFCSDTAYTETILPIIQNVNLLYHEATFLQSEAIWATKTGHSTAHQAATIAQKANAKALILGHFSNKHHTYIPFLEEAQAIFPNTYLPKELLELDVKTL